MWKYSMAMSLIWFTQKKKFLFAQPESDEKQTDPLWRSKARVGLGEKHLYILVYLGTMS